MSALIEKLERLEKEFVVKARNNVSGIMKLTATTTAIGVHKATEIVKQHSDWISVDERLPEPNKLVLVAIHRPQYYVPDFMYVTTADYDEVRKKWSSINLVDDLHNVVYWQPFPVIPKPPSEVKP